MRDTAEVIRADDAGILRAADILRHGGLVAVPTETVYGLAADATSDQAVARIFSAKGRPRFNPLIVHLPDATAADRYADLPAYGRRLAAAFWPGPLTLVAPLKADSRISPLVTSGLETVAIRVPDHPVMHRLLQASGLPLAAPSANPSGRISPTDAAHVAAGLGDAVDLILDGGACEVGVESTIVDVTGKAPVVLRAGAVTADDIGEAVGIAPVPADETRVRAPGQLARHYAGRTKLILNQADKGDADLYIGFGAADGDFNLSPAGDLTEAAANLFRILHEVDARGVKTAAVAPIPEKGLGQAINDRLRRAAAGDGTDADR